MKNISLPVNLRISGKKCLMAGGGRVAERKAGAVLAAGPEICLVAPEITPLLSRLVKEGKIRHHPRVYEKGDLKGVFLVIAATDNPKLNQGIAMDAAKQGILVNVANPSRFSTFTLPVCLRRGDLSIAIATEGKNPLLADRIKQELKITVVPEYEKLLDLLAKPRLIILSRVKEEKRKEILTALLDLPLLSLLRKNKEKEAEVLIARFLKQMTEENSSNE